MMLELRDICKTYLQGRLDVPVLQGISLSVEEGEYLAIMGPSGSGKTTLMNIIGCLDNPSSGEYILDGEDIGRISEKRMSEVRLHSIGFVFQSFYLLSRQSALDNVALPLLYAGVRRKERQRIARKALEKVGLGDRTEFKPTQLSGGQCQRVAIARAIVNNPKIILADEPTGALDTRSGQQIMEIFKGLNEEGVTIVMITHEPEIAAQAKRTLHIRDGLLVDSAGKPLNPPAVPAEPPQEERAPQEISGTKEKPAEGAEEPKEGAEEPKEKDSAPQEGQKPEGEASTENEGARKGLPLGLDQRLESLKKSLPGLKQKLTGLLPKKSQTEKSAPAPEENPPEEKPGPADQPAGAPGEEAPAPQAPPEKPQEGEALSGESIIAALERQAGQDREGTPEEGEGPSNEQ